MPHLVVGGSHLSLFVYQVGAPASAPFMFVMVVLVALRADIVNTQNTPVPISIQLSVTARRVTHIPSVVVSFVVIIY